MPQSSKNSGTRKITQQNFPYSSNRTLTALKSASSSVDQPEHAVSAGLPRERVINGEEGQDVDSAAYRASSITSSDQAHRIGNTAKPKANTNTRPLENHICFPQTTPWNLPPGSDVESSEAEPTGSSSLRPATDLNQELVKPGLWQQEEAQLAYTSDTNLDAVNHQQAYPLLQDTPFVVPHLHSKAGPYQRNPAFGRHSAGFRDFGVEDVFCSLDYLDACSDEPRMTSANVLLRGYVGSLDVYRISRGPLQLVGSISGFAGAILDAKVVPGASFADTFKDKRPLLIISRLESAVLPDPPDHRSPSQQSTLNAVSTWKTYVELRSLKTSECLSTLFSSETIEHSSEEPHLDSQPLKLARLHFKLDANGNFITITSCYSGEILIYCAIASSSRTGGHFRCIGKTWTAIHKFRQDEDVGPRDGDAIQDTLQCRPQSACRIPLSSLGGRWLAIVSPRSSQMSVLQGGSIPCSSDRDMAGIGATSPPPSHDPTCFLEAAAEDTFVNKMARGVAQEMLRGAKWVGNQGLQVWNSYWSSDSSRIGPQKRTSLPRINFPPTHSPSDPSSSGTGELSCISILDLKALAAVESPTFTAPTHVATFEIPAGCSLLSFSPTGLQLLIINEKGDEQRLLDLTTICPAPTFFRERVAKRSTNLGRELSVQFARQISKFTRYTDAVTVDVAWSLPAGDRIALATKHGTLHVFGLEGQICTGSRPSTRSSHRAPTSSPPSDREGVFDEIQSAYPSSQTSRSYTSGWGNALQSLSGTTSPLITAATSRARSFSSGTKAATHFFPTPTTILSGSGKAISTGLSRSLGAASESVNFLRHAGDNKLRLELGIDGVKTGRIRWLTGQEGYIAIASSDSIKLHLVREYRGPSERRTSITKEATYEQSLLELDEDRMRQILGPKKIEPSPLTHKQSLVEPQQGVLQSHAGTLHPLAFAEIDTHESIRPFRHRARRRVFTITNGDTCNPATSNSGNHLDSPDWSFGMLSTLPVVKIQNLRSSYRQGTKPSHLLDHPGALQEHLESSYEILERDL